jgi:hypothetical protein
MVMLEDVTVRPITAEIAALAAQFPTISLAIPLTALSEPPPAPKALL